MTTNRLENKDPAEKVTLTFDFTLGLAAGEILTGTPTAIVTLAFGNDPQPAAILNGVPAIDPTTKMVFVPVQAGIADCDYLVRVVAATSNATKVLALSALLPVRT